MIYAITDIETTGGHASGHSITEIACILHDGEKEIDRFHTLVQPDGLIPHHITELTGITNEMVADAPRFDSIAKELDDFMKDAIFVAHNVNFDYSFIKKQFEHCDMVWNRKRLCTVRLSRKIIPGLKSYSLANLCKSLKISNNNPHRALGDTMATVTVFEHLIKNDDNGVIEKALKRGSNEAILPINLKAATFHALPELPGVYYFHDSKGKLLYVGMSRNIKKRVKQHFSGKLRSSRRQSFMREIHDISFHLTGTELIARLLEDHEIRSHWPPFNRAQKSLPLKYGVFTYQDRRGYTRVAIQRTRNTQNAIVEFHSSFEAKQWVYHFADEHKLFYPLCGLPHLTDEEFPEVMSYNEKVIHAIEAHQREVASYVILGEGRKHSERSFVLMDNGVYRGFGYVDKDMQIRHKESLYDHLELAGSSETTKGILKAYVEKNSGEVVAL